jgi:ribosomal protein S18
MAGSKKKFSFKKLPSVHPKDIDFRNTEVLRNFVDSSGRILSFKQTSAKGGGINAKVRRQLKRAIKRARAVGLMPYVTPVEGFFEKRERPDNRNNKRFSRDNNRNNDRDRGDREKESSAS